MSDTIQDIDPIETQEWHEALDAVVREQGIDRARYLLGNLWRNLGVALPTTTPYCNTIPVQSQALLPKDAHLAEKITNYLRWNAKAMVLRGAKHGAELGGHLATYASSAILYETLFNYFLKGRTKDQLEDLIYVQGHASPGIYARAYLEGRLSDEQLDHFRREAGQKGVSSYPHPWLMPDFWQFPTVSMGLGALQSIYQARFQKYLHNRRLLDTGERKIWIFCGDGEMDEPESLGAITLAGRENLDNLIMVINCNLQRLDGPVRGNGKIIQELEGVFTGAGWRVIKSIWSSEWDQLLAKDTKGLLLRRMQACLDGDYQSLWTKDGAAIREGFFGTDPELLAMVSDLSDEAIKLLGRAGHDPQKVYAAYVEAMKTQGMPTVILMKSFKGYGMGESGEGQNITHQKKKMTHDELLLFHERFGLSLTDKQIENIEFCKPAKDSPEMQFMIKRRAALGGVHPIRFSESDKLPVPKLAAFESMIKGSGDREASTTMVFTRILSVLLKDKALSDRVVPIVPDECRTFGMEGLFRQIGIYSPHGQQYDPQDKSQLMYYREATDGQLLEEGITEAGAFCSWIAAASSYSTNALTMIPFYIYYSMFGFQRVGDLAWAAGDIRARGFLIGATAGRTTLGGEGLQHNDGHSHLLYDVVPNCRCYDPAYGYELAVIIHHGMERMYGQEIDEYYYISVMNENYVQPAMPKGVEEGIIRGMYRLQEGKGNGEKVQLMGSGTILLEVLKAAEILKDFNVSADVWSVTSFTELYRDILDTDRHNLLKAPAKPKQSYVQAQLAKVEGPFVAATDNLRRQADLIGRHIPGAYTVLGTDGFGRSDTRANLRQFFEMDAAHVAYAAIKTLVDEGKLDQKVIAEAKNKLNIQDDQPNPLDV